MLPCAIMLQFWPWGNSCCHLKGWNKIVIALTLICRVLWFDEKIHFYALHNNTVEWRELLEHESFSTSRCIWRITLLLWAITHTLYTKWVCLFIWVWMGFLFSKAVFSIQPSNDIWICLCGAALTFRYRRFFFLSRYRIQTGFFLMNKHLMHYII